jgi:hypothetical protein
MTTVPLTPKVKPSAPSGALFTGASRLNLNRFTKTRQRKTDMVDTLLCKQ